MAIPKQPRLTSELLKTDIFVLLLYGAVYIFYYIFYSIFLFTNANLKC